MEVFETGLCDILRRLDTPQRRSVQGEMSEVKVNFDIRQRRGHGRFLG
jgi:hypothetical protein